MTTTKPSKEQVRDWMQQRQEQKAPPPEPREVRRQLGWGLLREEDRLSQETHR